VNHYTYICSMKIEDIAKEIANKQMELRTSGLVIGESQTAHEARKKYLMPLMKIHRELELLKSLDELL